jgi:hypothetical protein
VIKRSIRYLALALSLVAFTSATQSASAQSTCAATNSCVVGGGDPEPMSTTRIILLILHTVLLP